MLIFQGVFPSLRFKEGDFQDKKSIFVTYHLEEIAFHR